MEAREGRDDAPVCQPPTGSLEQDKRRIPMTPQATLPPALPVFLESGCELLPKSSAFSCSTMARPRILWGPDRQILLSTKSTRPILFSSNSRFPRSPTWRSSSFGWPWFFWRVRVYFR
ncbi:unnamed protein product, partial [Plutella xylostella]